MSPAARALGALLLLVSTALGAVVVAAGPASACSCVEPTPAFLDTHDVAFTGTVTDRRDPGDEVIVTVRTDRVFKGDVTRRVDVVGGSESDTCSLAAQDGDEVLVFGNLDDDEVSSGRCSTVTGEQRRALVPDLGEGTAPAAGYLRAERRSWGLSHEQFAAGRAVLGVIGLVLLGWLAWRTWRARRRTP